ncbi:hypothetical protein HK405_013791, partial [Cladochytrium tenue]
MLASLAPGLGGRRRLLLLAVLAAIVLAAIVTASSFFAAEHLPSRRRLPAAAVVSSAGAPLLDESPLLPDGRGRQPSPTQDQESDALVERAAMEDAREAWVRSAAEFASASSSGSFVPVLTASGDGLLLPTCLLVPQLRDRYAEISDGGEVFVAVVRLNGSRDGNGQPTLEHLIIPNLGAQLMRLADCNKSIWAEERTLLVPTSKFVRPVPEDQVAGMVHGTTIGLLRNRHERISGAATAYAVAQRDAYPIAIMRSAPFMATPTAPDGSADMDDDALHPTLVRMTIVLAVLLGCVVLLGLATFATHVMVRVLRARQLGSPRAPPPVASALGGPVLLMAASATLYFSAAVMSLTVDDESASSVKYNSLTCVGFLAMFGSLGLYLYNLAAMFVRQAPQLRGYVKAAWALVVLPLVFVCLRLWAASIEDRVSSGEDLAHQLLIAMVCYNVVRLLNAVFFLVYGFLTRVAFSRALRDTVGPRLLSKRRTRDDVALRGAAVAAVAERTEFVFVASTPVRMRSPTANVPFHGRPLDQLASAKQEVSAPSTPTSLIPAVIRRNTNNSDVGDPQAVMDEARGSWVPSASPIPLIAVSQHGHSPNVEQALGDNHGLTNLQAVRGELRPPVTFDLPTANIGGSLNTNPNPVNVREFRLGLFGPRPSAEVLEGVEYEIQFGAIRKARAAVGWMGAILIVASVTEVCIFAAIKWLQPSAGMQDNAETVQALKAASNWLPELRFVPLWIMAAAVGTYAVALSISYKELRGPISSNTRAGIWFEQASPDVSDGFSVSPTTLIDCVVTSCTYYDVRGCSTVAPSAIPITAAVSVLAGAVAVAGIATFAAHRAVQLMRAASLPGGLRPASPIMSAFGIPTLLSALMAASFCVAEAIPMTDAATSVAHNLGHAVGDIFMFATVTVLLRQMVTSLIDQAVTLRPYNAVTASLAVIPFFYLSAKMWTSALEDKQRMGINVSGMLATATTVYEGIYAASGIYFIIVVFLFRGAFSKALRETVGPNLLVIRRAHDAALSNNIPVAPYESEIPLRSIHVNSPPPALSAAGPNLGLDGGSSPSETRSAQRASPRASGTPIGMQKLSGSLATVGRGTKFRLRSSEDVLEGVDYELQFGSLRMARAAMNSICYILISAVIIDVVLISVVKGGEAAGSFRDTDPAAVVLGLSSSWLPTCCLLVGAASNYVAILQVVYR